MITAGRRADGGLVMSGLSRTIAICAALAALSFLLAGCIFGGESERDLTEYFPQANQEVTTGEVEQQSALSQAEPDDNGVYTPPPEELEDLSRAPGNAQEAVQRFFHLLASGHLQEAWSTTSLETKERISAEDFERRYRDIWAEATIGGFSWELVPNDNVNAPSYEVILRYQTTFFGEIEERVLAPTLRQPHWVVHWTPDLIFAGLGPTGYLVRAQIETPRRGLILDRNGLVLAGVTEFAVVGVYWDAITDEDAVLNFFIERLQMDEEVVRALVYQDLPSYQFIEVAKLEVDTPAATIEEFERLASMGILVRRETRRHYPYGDLASHVIGYLQEINPIELEELFVEGYRAGDMIGRDGIEQSFERALAGRRGGHLVIIDPEGRPIREITYRPSIPGSNVRLTLDVRVQQLAEAALGIQPGAVVALDPRSGHVLAMASYPRINANHIVDGVTQEEYDLYFTDLRQPFINRAVEQIYAPGSTFKTVTLAAALAEGGYEISDRLGCPATWMEVGDQPLRNWKDTDQGRITLAQALAESCNTVFYEVGLQLDRQDPEILPRVARGFGFGARTGIIGLSEENGVIPGPDWKAAAFNDAWYTGDTINMSIGQGFVAVTPLQMANAYAALATNGVIATPMIIQSIEPEGAPPQTIQRRSINLIPVSGETLEELQAALRTVVSRPFGTGFYQFQGTVLRVAGKSGTAEDQVIDPETIAAVDEDEQASQDDQTAQEQAQQQSQQSQAEDGEQEEQVQALFSNHAWFSAWANFDEPRLVVTVVLDDGQSGTDDAGPIARRVLEGAILNDWVP